jgi:hypothetical protein
MLDKRLDIKDKSGKHAAIGACRLMCLIIGCRFCSFLYGLFNLPVAYDDVSFSQLGEMYNKTATRLFDQTHPRPSRPRHLFAVLSRITAIPTSPNASALRTSD